MSKGKAAVAEDMDELVMPEATEEGKSLKEIIAEYCGEYQLETTLNDVINKCVKERPGDPFGYMSELLKEKSNAATGILSISAREVLDCSGRPTVETEVKTDLGTYVAQAPCGVGKSRGLHEAVDLRDKDAPNRFGGEGVLVAVQQVNDLIAPLLLGKDPSGQEEIDNMMTDLDGTEDKSKIGANALLSVSMAICRAGAAQKDVPLYRHIADLAGQTDLCMPVPALTAISGGAHAPNLLAMQEFMLMPVGAETFKEALEWGHRVSACLAQGLNTHAGIEGRAVLSSRALLRAPDGGFAAQVEDGEKALELIQAAIQAAELEGKVKVAISVSASTFFNRPEPPPERKEGEDGGDEEAPADPPAEPGPELNKYDLNFKAPEEGAAKLVDGAMLTQVYRDYLDRFPDLVVSFEDPFDQDDWESFSDFTDEIGDQVQVVGDKLLATKEPRIVKAIEERACNALLLKMNQVGTLTEAVQAFKLAQSQGWGVMVSDRLGDTNDDFIADLAVGLSCGQIKSGALERGERISKYNRLLRIEEDLQMAAGEDNAAAYAGEQFRFPMA